MLTSFEMIVMGVSMGGFKTLQIVLGSLPPQFEMSVVVVQHRNPESGTPLARYLQKYCALTVSEPDDADPIFPGQVYLAPAGYHLMVEKHRFSLSTDAPVSCAKPSIDVLFESAADSYGARTIGVLLSGANDDGVRGLIKIKSVGGHVLVQDPTTAECPIMPQAAITSGVVDKVLPLPEMVPYIRSLMPSSRAMHVQHRQ